MPCRLAKSQTLVNMCTYRTKPRAFKNKDGLKELREREREEGERKTEQEEKRNRWIYFHLSSSGELDRRRWASVDIASLVFSAMDLAESTLSGLHG